MNEVVDNLPNISVITKIEVLGFNAPDKHYNLLTSFMDDANVFDLSENIVDESIQIRKKHKTKLPDAIIAATAIVYELVLITRNADDFKNIPNLKIINPHKL